MLLKKVKSIASVCFIIAGVLPVVPGGPVQAATSDLTLTSGNAALQDYFNWAKNRALSLDATMDNIKAARLSVGCTTTGGCEDPRVKDKYGVKPLIPAYWGSYADDINHFREAFCDRDIAHQSAAGHLLNMDNQNFSMFKTFAKAANTNTTNPYWPKWSYDFFGDGYYMDQDWRELPVPFELVQRSYEQYLWTGDDKWINDPDLFTYYTNVHTNFMKYQDQDNNGVADETKQLATYWEDANEKLFESGDAIGSQYQAQLAYSKILEARGDKAGAATYSQKAADLRNYFANNWYSSTDNKYIRGFTKDANNNKVGLTTWGHENSIFMPLKLITDQGPRTDSYLDFIDKSVSANGLGTEAKTYLPEMFYLQGRNEQAWKWMSNIMQSKAPYPENSFLFVSNTITGLMGIRPDAPNKTVYTLPRLTDAVPWVQADHVHIGGNDLMVRHDGNNKTTLKNNSGSEITWEAEFYGEFNNLLVSSGLTSNLQQASKKDLNGKKISYVSIKVSPGSSVTVKSPVSASNYTQYVSDLSWSGTPTVGSGAIQKDKSWGNGPLKLNGTTYSKGIGTHAASEITYNLNQQYSRFTADVGVDDDVADNGLGSVVFQVIGDGIKLFDSGTMRPTTVTQHVDVDVSRVNTLKLVVTDAGDGINSDHADWANAKLSTPWYYLSDWSWDSASTGWGSITEDKSVYNNTIKLNNVKYPKGIGTHANSEIVYNLNGQYSTFTATVGVDDEVGTNNGSVVFQVFADDVEIFNSGTMKGGGTAKKVNVSVAQKSKLKLKVTDAGDGINNDHADWADAKLSK